jgi:hypothetical protein
MIFAAARARGGGGRGTPGCDAEVGDEILSANGVDLAGCDFHATLEVLQKARRPLTIAFQKCAAAESAREFARAAARARKTGAKAEALAEAQAQADAKAKAKAKAKARAARDDGPDSDGSNSSPSSSSSSSDDGGNGAPDVDPDSEEGESDPEDARERYAVTFMTPRIGIVLGATHGGAEGFAPLVVKAVREGSPAATVPTRYGAGVRLEHQLLRIDGRDVRGAGFTAVMAEVGWLGGWVGGWAGVWVGGWVGGRVGGWVGGWVARSLDPLPHTRTPSPPHSHTPHSLIPSHPLILAPPLPHLSHPHSLTPRH